MSKEKFIWDIVSEILDSHGDMVDDISIHEHEECNDKFRKIYCSKGYCFEISEIPDEQEVWDDHRGEYMEKRVLEYEFNEPWDGFNEAGIDEAIKILNVYAGLVEKK